MIVSRSMKLKNGFTMVELLVALGILAIFLGMTATVTSNAVDLRKTTTARAASERNAAAVIRQFASDIAQRVKRREAPVSIGKNSGNDEMTFLTGRLGYAVRAESANRRVSLVSYRVKKEGMERAAVGYDFGETAEAPNEDAGTLSLKQLLSTGVTLPADNTYQLIAAGVLRFELSFIIRQGKQRLVRANAPTGDDVIEAIVVSLVTLDPDLGRMLNSSQRETLTSQFDDAVDNVLPADEWNKKAEQLLRDLPSLPRPALQQVRVHQSTITFPNLNAAL